MPKIYGWINHVEAGSLAEEAGIQEGDLLQAINGQILRDLIDYRFYSAEEELLLDIERGKEKLQRVVLKSPDEDLGLRFGEAPAPFIRQCANKCAFCFIKGLPQGMRSSLYIKDDDFRYSFLFGNFITLTNLKDKDWRRLEEQRLSPLFVSVHTTDPDLRRKMVAGPRAGEIIEHLQRLTALHITVHAQLVLCPSVNDGSYLDQSIRDLAALRPGIQSIAAVPVGLTKYNNLISTEHLPPLRSYTPAEAREIIEQVRPWQEQFRREEGHDFITLSDEFYLLAGKPFPSAKRYNGYPQIDNGVGMGRFWQDTWDKHRKLLPASLPKAKQVTWITGKLAVPILQGTMNDLNQIAHLTLDFRPLENQFFGPLVTCAGLLTAQDVLASLQEQPPGDLILLPHILLDQAGERFLDDMTIAELRARLDVPVTVVRGIPGLIETVNSLATPDQVSPVLSLSQLSMGCGRE